MPQTPYLDGPTRAARTITGNFLRKRVTPIHRSDTMLLEQFTFR